MNPLIERLRDEPAMIVAGILALATLFGVRFSQEQASALSQILTVLGPLIAGLIIRSQVSPTTKLDNAEAYPDDVPVEPFRP